ncbi:hypothetical protein F5Y18DRAFT_437342 [Xylariaceae sp. FL1019]|nr:hypothetical protein F5Y18DRAFT_437342 [Xylariaceae sp. FL1019]
MAMSNWGQRIQQILGRPGSSGSAVDVISNGPFPFDQLAPEICDMIWDFALLNESRKRFVLMNQESTEPESRQVLTMFPEKQLVSSYLSVNRRSRARAIRFYSHSDDVHKVQYGSTQQSLRPQDGQTVKAGKVYISPTHDTFVLGAACTVIRNQHSQTTFVVWCENKPFLTEVRKVCWIIRCFQPPSSTEEQRRHFNRLSLAQGLMHIPSSGRSVAFFSAKGRKEVEILKKGWASIHKYLRSQKLEHSFAHITRVDRTCWMTEPFDVRTLPIPEVRLIGDTLGR